MRWVLIVYIAGEMWIAMGAYPSENACYRALDAWELNGGRGACLKGTIEDGVRR